MSILSSIGTWFKKVFGSATATPKDYRRLSKAELTKLGLSPKSERFVRADIKRITKATKTVSKRAVQTARLNVEAARTTKHNPAARKEPRLTPEKKAKLNRPKVRKLQTGDREEHIYAMPTDTHAALAARLKAIQKKYAYEHDTYAHPVIEYGDVKKPGKSDGVTGTLKRLSEMKADDFFTLDEKSRAQYSRGIALASFDDDEDSEDFYEDVRFFLKVRVKIK